MQHLMQKVSGLKGNLIWNNQWTVICMSTSILIFEYKQLSPIHRSLLSRVAPPFLRCTEGGTLLPQIDPGE